MKQFEIYPEVLEYWAKQMNLLEQEYQNIEWVRGFIGMVCCTTIVNKPERYSISNPLEMLEYIKEWDIKYNKGKYSNSFCN